MKAPVGRSLHIGVNHIDKNHYGQEASLAGCEFDAQAMEAIATARGFKTQMLLTEKATAGRVTSAIADAAAALRPADIFLVTYAGHGAQVPDLNGDEEDEKDETWVLFDRMLVDDELSALWGRFAQAVRIVVVSDSCHSGSVTREALFGPPPEGVFRNLPRYVEEATYDRNKTLYDEIQAANPQGDHVGIGATILLLSGCLDNQLSRDGERNGAYTERLLQVWSDGAFKGGYSVFQDAIRELLPSDQSPNFLPTGFPNPLFEAQVPFTI